MLAKSLLRAMGESWLMICRDTSQGHESVMCVCAREREREKGERESLLRGLGESWQIICRD
jgi:hypothetical protein